MKYSFWSVIAFVASQSSGEKNLNRRNFKFKLLPLVLYGRIKIESTFRTWSCDGNNWALCACALLFTEIPWRWVTREWRNCSHFIPHSIIRGSWKSHASQKNDRPMNLPCVPVRLRITNSSSLDVFHSSLFLTLEIAKVLNTCVWNTIECQN